MAKYSRMTPDDLKQEWKFWVRENAWWEQRQACVRENNMRESFALCQEAIADNEATIALLEEIMLASR